MPTGFSAAPAGEGVDVTFTAPNQGDSAITKYQYSTDDGGTWTDATTTGDGPLHAVLDAESGSGCRSEERRAGEDHSRAVNSQGSGLPSDAAEVIMPSS